MPIKDPKEIKKIVQGNYDKSASFYNEFEQKYRLFEHLTQDLAQHCDLQPGMSVCDVGCGTGASSHVLKGLVESNGRVVGVDFSEQMLKLATEKLNEQPVENLDFIHCDANDLGSKLDNNLDCIIYNACIFLIPQPITTLRVAFKLLKSNGSVGMNYLMGLYERGVEDQLSVNNLFEQLKADGIAFAPYGRAINDTNELPQVLNQIGFRNIRTGRFEFELPNEGVKDFYTIPAHSAALWPKTPYEERLELLGSLMDYFEEKKIDNYFLHWGWCVAKK